jgi:hypothetical protein
MYFNTLSDTTVKLSWLLLLLLDAEEESELPDPLSPLLAMLFLSSLMLLIFLDSITADCDEKMASKHMTTDDTVCADESTRADFATAINMEWTTSFLNLFLVQRCVSIMNTAEEMSALTATLVFVMAPVASVDSLELGPVKVPANAPRSVGNRVSIMVSLTLVCFSMICTVVARKKGNKSLRAAGEEERAIALVLCFNMSQMNSITALSSIQRWVNTSRGKGVLFF